MTEPDLTEASCRQALEKLRWPTGPVCPHCGSEGPAISQVGGASHREGLYACSDCRGQFTVTVGTALAGSKLPISAWVQAAHMLNASKAVTVREIEQALGVTYKSAWHMVRKLSGSTASFKGPINVFGASVRSRLLRHLPKDRNSMAAWRRKQARKRAGTYKAPRVPIATGALSGLKFTPPPTKAHVERTERFLIWVLSTG
jgi:transposase-like protein